jgi:hypothetical protein
MSKKYTWKVWLILNKLTKNVLNDYTADVSTAGDTKSNQDVAEAIKKEGSELQIETLVDILNRGDHWKRQFLLEGTSVQDGNIRLSPRIPGSFTGADPHYDPNEHKISFDAISTTSMRKALDEEVGVEILGKQIEGGAIIGLVTDVVTGKTDGTITPFSDLIITGKKIKIDPVGEEGTGLFFVDANGTETPLTYPPLHAERPETNRMPRTWLNRRRIYAENRNPLLQRRYSAENTPHHYL